MQQGVDIRLVDFVEAVMERPAIYTRGGTYAEALAYLDGSLNIARNVNKECEMLHLDAREALERYERFLNAQTKLPADARAFLAAYRDFFR